MLDDKEGESFDRRKGDDERKGNIILRSFEVERRGRGDDRKRERSRGVKTKTTGGSDFDEFWGFLDTLETTE